jgi:hypothetical protein
MSESQRNLVSDFPSKYLFPDLLNAERALESVKAVFAEKFVNAGIAMKAIPGNRDKPLEDLIKEALELALRSQFWLESEEWKFRSEYRNDPPKWALRYFGEK